MSMQRNAKGEEIRTTRENLTQLRENLGEKWEIYDYQVQELRQAMYIEHTI